ncbi:hypothetical protein K474DRAFT_1528122 [Panus rudis PR-1116 ss-1]|nr:hypothetical protein K474DRAFT_1528122 [Panus rudis PR-1116 ss-1]
MHRRTMLLQSLIALSTNSNDPAALTNLTTQLAEITSASDRLLESMLRIADQRAQIQHLQDVHDASALAMALRKLNGSYAKRTQELRDARGKVESLKMELEEAWRAAEEMAQEMDDLENFQTGFSGSEAEGAHVNGGDAGANGQGGELEDDEQYAENDDSVNLAQVMNITGKAVSTKATTVTNPPPIPPHPPSAFSHERSKSTGTIMNGSVSGGDGASIRRRGTTTSSIRNGIESDRMSRVSAARKRSSRTSKASLRLPKSFNTPSPPSATTPNANGDTASITSRRSVRSSKSGKSVRSRGKPQRKGTINSDTGVSPSPGGANVNVNGQASTSQVPPVPNLGATPSAHPKEDSFLEMSETRPASPTTPTGSGVGENLPPLPTAKTASTTNGDANGEYCLLSLPFEEFIDYMFVIADTQSEVVPAPDASSSSSSSHRQLHSHSHSLSLTRSLSNPNSLSAEPRRPETLSFDIPPIDISFSDPPSNLSLTLSNPDLDGTRSRSSLDSLMNHHHSSTSSTQLQSTSTNSSTGRRVMSMQQPPSFLSRVRRGRGSGGGSGSGSELMGMSMSVDDTAIGSSSKGKKGKSKTRSKVFDGWPWSLSLGSSSSSHKDKDKEKDKEKDKKGKTRTSSESAGSSLGASVSTRKSTSGDGMGIGGSGSWRRTMTMPFMRASLDDSLRSSSSRGRIDEAVVEDEDEEAEVGESVGEGESANVAGEREEVHVGDLEVHGDVRADGSEKLEVVGGDDGAENQKGVEEVGQPEDEQGDDGEEEGEEGEGEGVEDEDPTVVLGSTFKTVDGEERGKDLPEGKQVDDELLPEGGHDHDTAEVTSTTVNPALESDTKPE